GDHTYRSRTPCPRQSGSARGTGHGLFLRPHQLLHSSSPLRRPIMPLPEPSSTTQSPKNHRRLQGRKRRLGTLVLRAARKSGTVTRLFQGVTGEYTIAHGGGLAQGHFREAMGDRLAHVVEVWCSSANDRTQGDHGVVVASQFLSDHGNLHRSGHFDHYRGGRTG